MNRHLNRFANLVILELIMLSLCALVRDSFALVLPPEAFLWLALLCGLLWIAESFRYGALIGLPFSAAVLWYLYQNRSVDLIAEAQDLLERISAVYYGHYSASSAAASVEGFSGNHMVVLLFVFFILAAFVSTALCSGSFRVSLVMLATVPLFALCIAVNGTPKILPVLGFLLSLAGLQLGGDVFRFEDGAGKSLFLGIIPCLMVLCALLLLYNPDNYEPTERDINLSQRFDKLGNALADWMSDEEGERRESPGLSFTPVPTREPVQQRAPSGWDQGKDDLDLTASFDASALDDEAFRVTASTDGSLYFRGRSYGDYNGTSWSAAVENSHGQALSFVARGIAAMPETTVGEFQLKSPKAYDVLYLPYYSISAAEGDVSVPAGSYSSYGGVYYLSSVGADALAPSVVLSEEQRAEELRYRDYAHSYYTRLPDSTRGALQQICSSMDWSAGQSGILWRVAEYVRSQGSYDVNVAPYPSDDYAVYFLTQSHTGYCIHFATAAAALYRTLGIPARVCEGYLVNNTAPGSSVKVTGADAHAWVEVYIDGLGWVPVEVTASAAEGEYQPSEGSVAPTPEALPSDPLEQTPPPEQGEDESPTEHSPDEPGSTPAVPANRPGETGPGTSSTAPQPMPPVLRGVLTGLAVLAAVAALIFGRYLILRKLLQTRLSDPDGKKRAVNLYRQAERVLRYGGEMPQELQQCAEKARFSQHEIGEEELQQCAEKLEELTQSVAEGLTRGQKLLFRFGSGNL